MNALKHILTCGGVALLLSSCASNLSTSTVSSSVPSSVSVPERAIADRVYGLVNSERSRAGKKALRGHNGLNKLAQKHSIQMGATSQIGATSQNANHLGSENRAQYAYLKHNIENLSEMTYAVPAGTSDPAAAAVSAWKNSAEHGRHMLQDWDLTGIGVRSSSNGKTYVTMCMGAQAIGVPRSITPVGWQ